MSLEPTMKGNRRRPSAPDLTRNDPSTMGASGGPITKDNTGAESTARSSRSRNLQSRKGFSGWQRRRVDSCVDRRRRYLGKRDPARTAGVVADLADRGVTARCGRRLCGSQSVQTRRFRSIPLQNSRFRQDLDKDHRWNPGRDFTRVIREPIPGERGLLYAGTETGIYVSFDDGRNWTKLVGQPPHGARPRPGPRGR